MAATLMILRATDLLTADHGHDRAVEIAIVLYVALQPRGDSRERPRRPLGDRRRHGAASPSASPASRSPTRASRSTPRASPSSALAFAVAGVGIGLVETAEHAAVAAFAPDDIRGSAFGLLAAIQSFGNLAASAVVGLLYTLVSPSLRSLCEPRSWSPRSSYDHGDDRGVVAIVNAAS